MREAELILFQEHSRLGACPENPCEICVKLAKATKEWFQEWSRLWADPRSERVFVKPKLAKRFVWSRELRDRLLELAKDMSFYSAVLQSMGERTQAP